MRAVAPNANSRIEFTEEPGLRKSVPAHRTDAAALPEFTIEYTGDPNSRLIPWPRRSLLRIIVLDERVPEPFRMNIPIAIGPTIGLYLGWWTLACGAILGIRWRDKIAHMDSVFRFAETLLDDLPFVGSIAAIGIPVSFALHYLGWGVALAIRGDAEDS